MVIQAMGHSGFFVDCFHQNFQKSFLQPSMEATSEDLERPILQNCQANESMTSSPDPEEVKGSGAHQHSEDERDQGHHE
jgi:hypothetical protein